MQYFMMKQRIEYKKAENAGKPPLHADDVVLTIDF